MFRIILTFFVLGITLGSGPCLASCGPLLITYCAGTRRNMPGAINAYLIFSFSRVLAYLILGVVTFFAGRLIFESFPGVTKVIQVFGGIFILTMAILMFLGKDIKIGFCARLHNQLLGENKKSMVALGILIGLLPCAPLFSVFTYSTLVSKTWFHAFLYSLSFGLGTIVSPLIILVIFAGLIPRIINQSRGISARIMAILCSLILIFLGLQLIGRVFNA